MTTVEFGNDFLLVEGHAGFAPKGEDIVCAAVSTLSQSFAQALMDMDVNGLRIKIADGEVRVRFIPSEKTKGAMAVARAGFRFLATNYPSYVVIKNQGDFSQTDSL